MSMKKITVNQSLLNEIVSELNEKINRNHISHISVINSTDILLQFSFYVKEKLFISLDHHYPLISLVDKSVSSPTIMGGLNENLRKIIKGAFIGKIEILNEDRVVKFSLEKTNDFYEKEKLYLILELIPTKVNLIILNENNKIIYAYHYSDLTSARPIVRGMEYIPIIKSDDYEIRHELSLEDYKEQVKKYIIESENKRKKEKQKPLYTFLVSKRKSLNRKIEVLKKEKIEATNNLVYKEYGEMIYAYLYDEEALKEYVKDNIPNLYDTNLTPTQNANKMFDKYKKCKRTIEHDDIEIEKAQKEIEELTITIDAFDYLDEEEIIELHHKYRINKGDKKGKIKSNPKLPYFVEVNHTKIAFGKNTTQNDYLTFKKARKDDLFFHIEGYTGSHVVILNNNPTNEEKLIASEICLILSNKTTGDIRYTKINELKKGPNAGQVIFDKYQLITLRNVRNETYDLLRKQKRFSD